MGDWFLNLEVFYHGFGFRIVTTQQVIGIIGLRGVFDDKVRALSTR